MDNFNFKKSLGQNFLIDNNIREKIVSSASIEDNSLIIEEHFSTTSPAAILLASVSSITRRSYCF